MVMHCVRAEETEIDALKAVCASMLICLETTTLNFIKLICHLAYIKSYLTYGVNFCPRMSLLQN